MSTNSANREQITQLVSQADEDMHQVFADVNVWILTPGSNDIDTLKQDVTRVSGAAR